jgi:hypothetical protein
MGPAAARLVNDEGILACVDWSTSTASCSSPPTGAATGRDIKGLTKLVAKFCNQKQVAPGLEVFRRCSIFRGMEASGAA